jgi:hypothetical protein
MVLGSRGGIEIVEFRLVGYSRCTRVLNRLIFTKALWQIPLGMGIAHIILLRSPPSIGRGTGRVQISIVVHRG